jgi:effector-binding domain-containing protein
MHDHSLYSIGEFSKITGLTVKTLRFYHECDTEYREDDADFEECMPIRKGSAADGISVRELPGGTCVSLVHQGPYDELGRSYTKIFKHVKAHGLEVEIPTREVYLKGPGMIFKGNPKKVPDGDSGDP